MAQCPTEQIQKHEEETNQTGRSTKHICGYSWRVQPLLPTAEGNKHKTGEAIERFNLIGIDKTLNYKLNTAMHDFDRVYSISRNT